jgi:GT2 family glycosyltransferase
MKNPKVAVVVLNYKGWQDSIKCVESILKQSYKQLHVVLIENGSGDASAKELAKLKDPKLTYIVEPINHGFTGGVNIGISWAIKNNYDAVALFNNDAIAEPDWLDYLVDAQIRTKASIVTGLLLSYDGKKIDDAGDSYSTWGIPTLLAENQPISSAPEAGFVFGATGGATLYKTSLFKAIGLFDDVYFAYNEDVDIDWRAQLTGHKIYYEPSAIAYHKHSATSKKMPGFTTTQVFRNLPVVFIKNVPFPMVVPMGIKFFFLYWAFVFYKVIRGEWRAAFRGVFKSITLWPHALRERRKVQSTKTVTNAYISSILYKGMPLRSVKRLKHFMLHPFSHNTELDY